MPANTMTEFRARNPLGRKKLKHGARRKTEPGSDFPFKYVGNSLRQQCGVDVCRLSMRQTRRAWADHEMREFRNDPQAHLA